MVLPAKILAIGRLEEQNLVRCFFSWTMVLTMTGRGQSRSHLPLKQCWVDLPNIFSLDDVHGEADASDKLFNSDESLWRFEPAKEGCSTTHQHPRECLAWGFTRSNKSEVVVEGECRTVDVQVVTRLTADAILAGGECPDDPLQLPVPLRHTGHPHTLNSIGIGSAISFCLFVPGRLIFFWFFAIFFQPTRRLDQSDQSLSTFPPLFAVRSGARALVMIPLFWKS